MKINTRYKKFTGINKFEKEISAYLNLCHFYYHPGPADRDPFLLVWRHVDGQ
jgi:hypothetical protein